MIDFGLQKQAERHFRFLVTDKGYRCVMSSPSRVRFESSKVYVELVFDAIRSFELELIIGEMGSEKIAFTLGDVLRRNHAHQTDDLLFVQVQTPDALAEWVAKLADALRRYGDDVLEGKKEAFAELAQHRTREAENYARERELSAARVEVETAWRSKDYATIVRVLSPLRAALTATEVGKLEFAEKEWKRA